MTHTYLDQELICWPRLSKNLRYEIQSAFTTVEQILKANANGFIIAQRGGMKSYVTIGAKDSSGNLVYEVGDDCH